MDSYLFKKEIRSPMGVEHSGEGIFGHRSHNVKSSSKELSTLVADRVKNVNTATAVAT